MPKSLSNYLSELSIGDQVSITWIDGKKLENVFYAGSLEGFFQGIKITEESLFVYKKEDILTCKESRNYIKISYGYSVFNPGKLVNLIEPIKS